MTPDLSMPPAQVRRRANDFDSQVRQGLDDGTIRKVVKSLGDDLPAILSLRVKGTPDQIAAFPRPLFLVPFVRAWNADRSDPNFIEKQLAARAQFDLENPPAPLPQPKASAPTHPKNPPPLPKHTLPPQAGPSGVRTVRVPKVPTRSPTPERKGPVRLTDRASSQTTHPAPSQPARGEHRGSQGRHQKLEVVMPPRSPVKFTDINDTEDEYESGEPTPSPPRPKPRRRKVEPSPSPPPPARLKQRQRPSPTPSPSPPRIKGKRHQVEPTPSPSPPPTRRAKKRPETIQLLVFRRACVRCEKGKRDCVEGEVGAACLACKQHKYKCDKTGSRNEKTMTVTRPASDPESEAEEERRGKKRRAESPLPAKKATRVKKEKETEKEKEREKEKEKGTAKERKPKAKARAKRVPPKSTPNVLELSDDSGPMVLDEESGKPSQARARDFNAEHDKRLAVLEERMKAFDKMAEESTRTSKRMDAMEDNVHRFTGALENFLGRIHIDDRLRLVPDSRRIGGSHSPSPLLSQSPSLAPILDPRSASPSAHLDIPMDEDSPDPDVASSHPDTRTTPSDINLDVRMVHPGVIGAGAAPDPGPIPLSPTPNPVPLPDTPPPALPPTLHVVPATPQVTQPPAVPSPIPESIDNEVPAPGHSTSRARSRTPAHLVVQGGPTTRARARSKTPI